MSEATRRSAQVIADEFLKLGGHRVKPGYMFSANGDEGPLIGAEAKAAFQRHRDKLPAGARVVEQVTIKGYPVTFYDMPKRHDPLQRPAWLRFVDCLMWWKR